MAQTPPPTIDPAPAPAPQRGDRATFSDRVDAFVNWIITAVTQFYALALNVYNNAVDAFGSAQTAAAQAAAAQAAVNVQKWVSGTTYAIGDARWSPANGQTYRRRTAGAGTTDPSADATNWDAVASNLIPTAVKASNYNIVRADKGANLSFGSGTFTATLPLASSVGNGWYAIITNYGSSGAVTVAASGSDLINGEATFSVGSKCWLLINCNGSNFEVISSGLRAIGRLAGFSIGAAASINLNIFDGDTVHITGSADISSFTLSPGVRKTIVFDGSPRLVTSATLPLPGAADMFMAPNSTLQVMGDAGGVTRVVGVGKANTGYMQVREESTTVPTPATSSTVDTSVYKRVPNTVKQNTIAGASLNGTGDVLLPPGRYRMRAIAQGARTNSTFLKLWNTSTGALINDGAAAYMANTVTDIFTAHVEVTATVTFTANTLVSLHQYVTSDTNSRFGPANAVVGRTFGVFSEIEIWKEG